MSEYIIGNDCIRRTVEVSSAGVRTLSIKTVRDGREWLRAPVREFGYAVDDVLYSSHCPGGVREVDGNPDDVSPVPRFLGSRRGGMTLELDFAIGPTVATLCHEVYPGLCGTRKHLVIRNAGRCDIRLSSLVFDDTCAAPGRFCDCDWYAGNGDHPQSVCFTLEGVEDIIRCHDEKLRAGWLMGTTAPGVLRFYMVYPNWQNAINGLNMSSAPFARYLKPGESYVTPASIQAFYAGDLSDASTVSDFRSIVRAGLPALKDAEGIMYCTWIPFLKDVDVTLALELAERAAAFGFRSFVLDDGWFTGDDRRVDAVKYPGGLEVLAARVHELGMRFGLWLNVGTDYGMRRAPEHWMARRPDGKPNRLGFNYASAQNILCLGSAYREFALAELDRLASRYGVDYFKLDFSSVFSPYGISPWGCHATDHEHHRGWEDSFMAMYDGMTYVRDEMLKRHPWTTLDFSFEAFGTERPNIAALELSELHHVSNASANKPDIQSISQIRRNFYAWLGKLPPERILNGLLSIQGEQGAEYLLTSFAGAPLVAGDLRKLDAAVERRMRLFTRCFNEQAAKGAMTEFAVLDNSADTDGFMRVAQDGHGVAAFFNRGDRPWAVSLPSGRRFINVEDGQALAAVPPRSCAMCRVEP